MKHCNFPKHQQFDYKNRLKISYEKSYSIIFKGGRTGKNLFCPKHTEHQIPFKLSIYQ